MCSVNAADSIVLSLKPGASTSNLYNKPHITEVYPIIRQFTSCCSGSDGDASDANGVLVTTISRVSVCGACSLTTMPLEQLTVVPEQVLPEPTPMTVMGLQTKPRATSRSSRTTPMLLRRAAPAAELA